MCGAKPIAKLQGHTDEVVALAVTPDSRKLISGDRSGVIRIWDLTTNAELGLLTDAAASPVDARGTALNVVDIVTGRTITYTLPCGSPIPVGAVCTCNCVPGTLAVIPPPAAVVKSAPVPREPRERPEPIPREPKEPRMSASQRRAEERMLKGLGNPYPGPYYGGGGGGTTCTCNKVCVCIPVCQASHLLSADLPLARMAEFILYSMAPTEPAYMQWAWSQATPALKRKHAEVDRSAALFDVAVAEPRFSIRDCVRRLDRADEVVRIIAAQSLTLLGVVHLLPPNTQRQIAEYLMAARLRPWRLRYGVDGDQK